MSKRYVTVLGRAIPLGAYVAAIKVAKANPTKCFKTGLSTWWPTTGAEIMEQFIAGVQDRISQAAPYSKRGHA